MTGEQLTIFDVPGVGPEPSQLAFLAGHAGGLLGHVAEEMAQREVSLGPGESIAPVCLTGPGLTVRSDGLAGE